MKKKFGLLAILVCALTLGLMFVSCSDGGGGGGGGGGNWEDMVGTWKWTSGSNFVTLKFDPTMSMNIGWTGSMDWDNGSLSGGGLLFWLRYDGTKLQLINYDGTLEHEWTVSFNSDKDELTFSDYVSHTGSYPIDYEYMAAGASGKTYIKQP